MANKKRKPATKKKPAPTKKKAAAKKPLKKKAAKAAAKKPASKKAAAKKPAAKPVKKPAARHKPIKRRDATGHLDPSYERDLQRTSRENEVHDDDRAFLVGKASGDALAEELGREFVETVTSGEDEGNEVRDEFVPEEVGGPFVTTTRGQEVDEKPDESNPEGATREPFPKTSS
jgi:hypothetical protein